MIDVLPSCLAGLLLAVAEKVQDTPGRFSVVLLRGPGCRYMVPSGLSDPGEVRDGSRPSYVLPLPGQSRGEDFLSLGVERRVQGVHTRS